MNRGSVRRTVACPAHGSRFNEAPIHESGKYERGQPTGIRRIAASMRPRFMNRGSERN